jgi:hypothetical protein
MAAAGTPLEDRNMSMYLAIGPVVALIAGILILIVPRLLNYIVAVYLIIIGIIGLTGGMHYRGTAVRFTHAVAVCHIVGERSAGSRGCDVTKQLR